MATTSAFDHPVHPPRAVSRLTGLSTHVLRSWERRYEVVAPTRTPSGARRYSPSQVERLRRLADAVRSGHAIGSIVALTNEELARVVAPTERMPVDVGAELVGAALRLDARRLSGGLGLQLAARGPRGFAREVAHPLLVRIGDLWEQGKASIAVEHLVTREVRAVLEVASRSLGGSSVPTRIVMATPVGERHDLGLLIASIGLEELGASVVLLGGDLPAEEIATAQRTAGAAAIGLSLVCLGAEEARGEVERLRDLVSARVPIWVGGSRAGDLDVPGVEPIASLDALDEHVRLLVTS